MENMKKYFLKVRMVNNWLDKDYDELIQIKNEMETEGIATLRYDTLKTAIHIIETGEV